MSWIAVKPVERHHRKILPACSMRVGIKGTSKRHILLSLRPDEISAFLSWWVPGAKVSVMLGADDHAGKMRVEESPHGEHLLSKTNGKSTLCYLKIPAFDWIDANEHVSDNLNINYSDKWLEVGLPFWAVKEPVWREPAPPKSAYETGAMLGKRPATVEPTRAQKVVQGFSMAAMALPDPMIDARKGNGSELKP